MKINIIAAIGKNNEIGLNNKLLWKSKYELKHFKQMTLGKPIIMGRKTFESLPGVLPGREHIIITSEHVAKAYSEDNPHVHYIGSLQEAIAYVIKWFNPNDIFIVGGASIYKQALPLADELHITHMDWEGKADTYFPKIDLDVWKVVGQRSRRGSMDDPLPWTYKKYTRK